MNIVTVTGTVAIANSKLDKKKSPRLCKSKHVPYSYSSIYSRRYNILFIVSLNQALQQLHFTFYLAGQN